MTKPVKTTKEKLLDLINQCIENENYYNTNNVSLSNLNLPSHVIVPLNREREKISYEELKQTKGIHLEDRRQYTLNNKILRINCEKFYELYDYGTRNAIERKVIEKEKLLTQETQTILLGQIKINFDKKPPLIISYEVPQIYEVIGNNKLLVSVERKAPFFSFKKYITKLESIDLDIKQNIGQPKFYITFGVLEAELSFDEYNQIWDKIALGYKDYLISIHNKELDKRIKEVKTEVPQKRTKPDPKALKK